MMKKRIFSGVRPSGSLHIGNYLGAIKNWLELQKKYECVFCVVDLHALTTPTNPKTFRKDILELAAAYLQAGINPEKSIVFIQSHVPEHAELAWLLNTITKIPELERMTQFKEKSQQSGVTINAGLLAYPVLMAADILLYQTQIVPVGQDQKQHVEITRTLARRFNRIYGRTFTVPKTLIKKESAKIMGLDNPAKKMSKSASSPYNYIALSDSPQLIKEKIKKAVTDSGKEIRYTADKPALSNLMDIYHCFSQLPLQKIENKYRGQGYASFKKDLAQLLIDKLEPFRKPTDYAKVEKILVRGSQRAKLIAQKTLKQAKQKMGLI